MKCTVCDGRGYFPVSNIAAKVCPQCNGTDEIEQTNEEWFCSLSAEEKAYFLSVEAVRTISEYENNGTERTCSSFWEYWLKEVHKE